MLIKVFIWVNENKISIHATYFKCYFYHNIFNNSTMYLFYHLPVIEKKIFVIWFVSLFKLL